MEKKKLLQLFLILLIFFLIIVSYFFFNHNQSQSELIKKKQSIEMKSNNQKNLIEGIKYISKDKSGNIYEITAKSGKNDLNDENLIFLNNVNALIKLPNYKSFKIWSNYAEYNNINYNSKFYKNVLVVYGSNRITCDNAIINFSDESISLLGNVIFTNLTARTDVDKIHIDINSKKTKMSMFKSSEKIKISVNNGAN